MQALSNMPEAKPLPFYYFAPSWELMPIEGNRFAKGFKRGKNGG
jgi:hypothetical protein